MNDVPFEKTSGLGTILDVLDLLTPMLASGPDFTRTFVGDIVARLTSIERAPGPAPRGFAEVCDRAVEIIDRLGHADAADRIRALGAIARREIAEQRRTAAAPAATPDDDIGWIDTVANTRGMIAALGQWQLFSSADERRQRAEAAVSCFGVTATDLRSDDARPEAVIGMAALVEEVAAFVRGNGCPDLLPEIARLVSGLAPPGHDAAARWGHAEGLIEEGDVDRAARGLLWHLGETLSALRGRSLLARATGGLASDGAPAAMRIWQGRAAAAADDFGRAGAALTDAMRLLDDLPPSAERARLVRSIHNTDRWMLTRRRSMTGASAPASALAWADACYRRQRGESWLVRLNRGEAAYSAAESTFALGRYAGSIRWAERARRAVEGLAGTGREQGHRATFLSTCVDTRLYADITRARALLEIGQVQAASELARRVVADAGRLPSSNPAMLVQAGHTLLQTCRAAAARHDPQVAQQRANAGIESAIDGLPPGWQAIARAFATAAGMTGSVDPSTGTARTADELVAAERKWSALSLDGSHEQRALAGFMLGGVGRDAFLAGAHDLAARCLGRALMSSDMRGEAAEARAHAEWLAEAERARGRIDVATFYAARAVRALEMSRAELIAVQGDWADSFVDRRRTAYALLADLLLSQGRLLDAERVLARLKSAEFRSYTRDLELTAPLELGADAARWMTRYDAAVEALQAAERAHESALARWRADLGLVDRPTIEAAAAAVARTRDAFIEERRALEAEMARGQASAAAAHDLDGALAALPARADVAALQYLVTPRRLHLIARIGDGPPTHWVDARSGEQPDWPTTLARRIVELRAAVIDRRDLTDLPAARALAADLLPEPIRRAIASLESPTVLFALDGPLRYLPMAALPHPDDGRVLIEHWPIAHYTPAARTAIDRAPVQRWTASAFGVTRAHGDFEPLPHVHDELAAVATALPDSTTALDAGFTEPALVAGLDSGRPIVHCATHFTLDAQRHAASGLLLGDGTLLTLADLVGDAAQRYRFAHVDLLTLSACQTAFGAETGDGREVESLGVIAQRRGAQSVLASLWKVSDAGTAALMKAFYAALAQGASKAEALRRAQLSMLRGVAPSDGSTRGSVAFDLFGGPTRPTHAAAWYWAPFVLMGHWG